MFRTVSVFCIVLWIVLKLLNMDEEYLLKELVESDFPLLWNSSDSDSTSLSSISSSSSEGEPRQKKTRIRNYLEVVQSYSEEEFKRHFRMKRTTADILIERIKNANVLPSHADGREKIKPAKAFLMTIWYMANLETFRQVADRFDCTESSVHRNLNRIIDYLLSIKAEIIKWPNLEQYEIISNALKNIKGIENVIGLIDGTHIEIPKPKNNQDAYCNRKGYHSLLLQGIVDNNKKFIDVFCGEPGSMNDARLLRKSGIFKKIEEDPNFVQNYFLLGDSAYPNLHWIVTPFIDNGNLSRQQRQFNYFHSATRIIVENAFGLLKSRFRRLKRLDNINMTLCSKIIMVACILHNICIDYNDIIEEEAMDGNQPEPVIPNMNIAGGNTRQLEVFEKLFGNIIN